MDERHRKNLQLACNANQDENGAVTSPTISPIDELNRQLLPFHAKENLASGLQQA